MTKIEKTLATVFLLLIIALIYHTVFFCISTFPSQIISRENFLTSHLLVQALFSPHRELLDLSPSCSSPLLSPHIFCSSLHVISFHIILQYYSNNRTPEYQRYCETLGYFNMAFTVLFSIESGLKLIAFGPKVCVYKMSVSQCHYLTCLQSLLMCTNKTIQR